MTRIEDVLAAVHTKDLAAALRSRGRLTLESVPTEALVEELRKRGLLVKPRGRDELRLGALTFEPEMGEGTWRGRRFGLRARAAQVLEQLIVARGRPRTVEELAVSLYGACDESARTNLRTTVYDIRKVVPGLVQSRPNYGYWLAERDGPTEKAA